MAPLTYQNKSLQALAYNMTLNVIYMLNTDGNYWFISMSLSETASADHPQPQDLRDKLVF